MIFLASKLQPAFDQIQTGSVKDYNLLLGAIPDFVDCFRATIIAPQSCQMPHSSWTNATILGGPEYDPEHLPGARHVVADTSNATKQSQHAPPAVD